MPLRLATTGDIYRRMARLCRLLALVAVLLLPFAMASAPAATNHAAMATAMNHDHSGHQPHNMTHDRLGECTMACSAALPAADLPPIALRPIAHPPAEPLLVPRLSGIELDIATPPPRLS